MILIEGLIKNYAGSKTLELITKVTHWFYECKKVIKFKVLVFAFWGDQSLFEWSPVFSSNFVTKCEAL